MKIKISPGDAVLAWLLFWCCLNGDTKAILLTSAIAFVANFIVNPRWSLAEGWRFKP